MADRVIIPLGSLGVLALDREVFDAGIAAGAEFAAPGSVTPASVEPLLSAEQAGALVNLTARCLEDSARAGIVPHYRLGKFIRFRLSEIAAHCRSEGAQMPRSTQMPKSTALESVGRKNRFITQ